MSNITQLTQKWASHGLKIHQRRGVSPIIATLLLVAIAVVGGSIIFVFSQGFFATAQISGYPSVESIKILGYDATDGDAVQFHDGVETVAADLTGSATSDGLRAGEYVIVYLKNDSITKVTLDEIRVAGEIYDFVDLSAGTPTYLPAFSNTCTPTVDLDCREYSFVVIGDNAGTIGLMSDTRAPELQPGQEASLIFAIDKDVKVGRDMQFMLTTTNGAVFVATVLSGQQNGI